MNYRELMRRKLLAEMLSKMSPEEQQAYAQLTKDSEHKEVMDALSQQHEQLSRVARKTESQNWLTDFSSDVAANFFTDGLIWLGSRILRKL